MLGNNHSDGALLIEESGSASPLFMPHENPSQPPPLILGSNDCVEVTYSAEDILGLDKHQTSEGSQDINSPINNQRKGSGLFDVAIQAKSRSSSYNE